MERVVVTGGAGFVSDPFVKRCLEQGYNVTIIDNLSNYNVSNDNFQFHWSQPMEGFHFTERI